MEASDITDVALDPEHNNIIDVSLENNDCPEGARFTFTFTPADVTDMSDNAGTGSPVVWNAMWTYPPHIVSQNPSSGSTISSGSETLTVVFNKAIDPSSISGSNLSIGPDCATVTSAAQSSSNSSAIVYVVNFSGCANSSEDQQNITVTMNPANVTDIYGNSGNDGDASWTYTMDEGPQITGTSPQASASSVSSSFSATYSVTFDRPLQAAPSATALVRSYNASSESSCVSVGTPTLSNGNETVNFPITNTCGSDAYVTLSFNGDSVTDTNGVTGVFNTVEWIVNVPPTIVSHSPGSTINTNNASSAITFHIEMSEEIAWGSVSSGNITISDSCASVSNFYTDDCVVNSKSKNPRGDCGDSPGLDYTVDFSGCSNSDSGLTITFDPTTVTGEGGTAGTGGTVVWTYNLDTTAPTIVSTDPTNGGATTNSISTSYSITMSNPMASVTTGDLSISGDSGSCLSVSSAGVSGDVITFTLSDTCVDGDGSDVVVSFNPSSVTDIYGNSGTGSTVTWTYNITGPRVVSTNPPLSHQAYNPYISIIFDHDDVAFAGGCRNNTGDDASRGCGPDTSDIVTITASSSSSVSSQVPCAEVQDFYIFNSFTGHTDNGLFIDFTYLNSSCTSNYFVTFYPTTVQDQYGNLGLGSPLVWHITGTRIERENMKLIGNDPLNKIDPLSGDLFEQSEAQAKSIFEPIINGLNNDDPLANVR